MSSNTKPPLKLSHCSANFKGSVSLTNKGHSSNLVDEVKTRSVDGHMVPLLIKVHNGTNYTEAYTWVDYHDNHVVIVSNIADPDCLQALFEWIYLKLPNGVFACILQNYKTWQSLVVGVTKFDDGEPLTLQLQGSNNAQHYYLYTRHSGDYFSLHLKSPDGHLYYILPMNGTLRIYREDTIRTKLQHHDLFVFKTGSWSK